MENNNNACHSCMPHGSCGYGQHRLLRWALGILILVIVFKMGVVMGGVKSMFHDQYGSYGNNWMMRGNYRVMPMQDLLYQQRAPLASPVAQ